MSVSPVMFTTGKDDWETPHALFDRYNNRFNFILDAAADMHNTKCFWWFGPGGVALDALARDWPLEEGNIWLNPPYSRPLQLQFVQKAVAEVQRVGRISHNVVCLLPARTDTRLFHDYCLKYGAVEFLRGRLRFVGGQSSAPFPSMVVIF